jgi:hypothetical protein
MIVTFAYAEEDMCCHRCISLGIIDPTILEGNEYVIFKEKLEKTPVCMDCWDALTKILEEE